MANIPGNKKQPISKLTVAWRLFFCFCCLIMASGFSFLINDRLINWLQAPLGQNLFYSASSSLSGVTLIASLTFGLIFTLPIFVYQTARLFELSTDAKSSYAIAYALASIPLTIIGILCARYIAIPAALKVFEGTNGNISVSSLGGVGSYFMHASAYLITTTLLCQMAALLPALNRFAKYKTSQLLQLESYAVFICLVPAAILTPTTSPILQIEIAALMTAPYLLGVAWIALNKESVTARPTKLIDPFHLPIPDAAMDAVLSTKTPPNFDIRQEVTTKTNLPKHTTKPHSAQAFSNAKPSPAASSLSRYKGMGYARQPASYKTRPRRVVINDIVMG